MGLFLFILMMFMISVCLVSGILSPIVSVALLLHPNRHIILLFSDGGEMVMETEVLVALIGAGGVLLGAVIGASIPIFIYWL